MSNKKNDSSMKHDRHLRRCKRQLKSSVVRDSNGSISTFRQFYQSGGRDYEQYRLWLQTLTSPSVDSEKIKKEPTENKSDIVSPLPPVHSPPTPRILCTLPLRKPMQCFSIPKQSSHLPTTSLESQIRLVYDHSPLSITPPMSSWSVIDVGCFIQKHFPEKNTARKFIEQKIDGHSLPLLTEDHLIRIFKMKLGPALHLLALILTIPK